MRSLYSLCFALLMLLCLHGTTQAQVAKEVAVVPIAEIIDGATPAIRISWPGTIDDFNAIRRREYGSTTWGTETPIDVENERAFYVDDNVEIGKVYEYRVSTLRGSTTAYGFITAGIDIPARISEGTLLLLVGGDASVSAAAEIETYIDDVIRAGYNVEMQVVPEGETPQQVKERILEVSNRLGGGLRSLFLFGRVPIPYSGNIAPDGHVEDHEGAWPADVYYGDLDGVWTDATVNNTKAERPENDNIPGDGKLDQSVTPSRVELEVGRVDMRNMGWFYIDAPSQAEREAMLLRNYLQKDHKFRIGQLPHNNKAVVSDVFGRLAPNDIPASIAWRGFPMLTESVESIDNWMDKLSAEPHHWAYGGGYGTWFAAEKVGTTEEYSKRDPKVIFSMLFGSRFGDWDSHDNLLRAPLGTSTGLGSMWAGRPYWYVHQMGLGMTIGEATRQSQSASGSYIPTLADETIQMALMGDPTLHNIELAQSITGLSLAGQTLNWEATPGSEVRYVVSRATTRKGPYTPVTLQPIAQTSFTTDGQTNAPFYLVRPVIKLQTTSGTFYQSGRGTIINILNSVHEPVQAGALLTMSGDAIMVQAEGESTLTIIDVLGRVVVERSFTGSASFDASGLNPGAYIANLRTTKATETLRFNR